MHSDVINKKATELRVDNWIDGEGNPREPLRLSDLGDGYKVLYCFQHWCPGCHARGFPTLKKLVDQLSGDGFGFAVIQTVFEGGETNTVDKLRENQLKYELSIPFGHDVPSSSSRLPTVMQDYQTGGTPWFIVIDPQGTVIFADFHLDADRFIAVLASGEPATAR